MVLALSFETQKAIALRLGYISEKKAGDLDEAVSLLKRLLPKTYVRVSCEILWDMTQYCDFREIVMDIKDLQKMTDGDWETAKDPKNQETVDEIIDRLSLPPETVIRIVNETAGFDVFEQGKEIRNGIYEDNCQRGDL